MNIPTAAEMQESFRANLEARLKREGESYPTRWEQWEKHVAQALQSCKNQELRHTQVHPPTYSNDWDLALVTALDRRAMEDMNQKLSSLGYTVRKTWSATEPRNRRLEIHWS